MTDATDNRKSNVLTGIGQAAAGFAGFYVGHEVGEPLASAVLDNLDLPPEAVDVAEPALAIGAGLATGFAAIGFARRDPNSAILYAAGTAAAVAATAASIKIGEEVAGIHGELQGISEQLDTAQPGGDSIPSFLPVRDFGVPVYATHTGDPPPPPDIGPDPDRILEQFEATSGGFGTEGPNGGPSNDPDAVLIVTTDPYTAEKPAITYAGALTHFETASHGTRIEPQPGMNDMPELTTPEGRYIDEQLRRIGLRDTGLSDEGEGGGSDCTAGCFGTEGSNGGPSSDDKVIVTTGAYPEPYDITDYSGGSASPSFDIG